MTKTELKKTVVKIKKLLKQQDYDIIDSGIELVRGLDEPAVFEALLGGWCIKDVVVVANGFIHGGWEASVGSPRRYGIRITVMTGIKCL